MYKQAGFTLYGTDYYFKLAKEQGDQEKELFEDIELFEGGEFYDQEIDAIDKDILYDEIMSRYGELLTYEQNPIRFKRYSDSFFKKNYKNFAKMQIALQMDFNPIYNYDRFEDWSDKTTYDSDMEYTGSVTRKLDNSTGDFKEKLTPSETTTKYQNLSNESNGVRYTGVSADNSGSSGVTTASNYSPQTMEYETVTPSKTEVTVDNDEVRSFEGVGYEVNTFGKDISLNNPRKDIHSGDDTLKHDGHIYGNIGVTTSTQMIKEILELYDFDIYKFIADKYAKERLLLLY